MANLRVLPPDALMASDSSAAAGEVSPGNVVVMFADVAGSTRLYEQLGDAQALAMVTRCLNLARESARRYGGRLIKTFGDEAMLVFPTADGAAEAAAELQRGTSDLADDEHLPLAFRIGIHLGPAIERDGDVFGDSVNVAARMVALAKSGQIILSAATAEALPSYLHGALRALDVLTVKGKEKDIGIVELMWQVSADLTTVAARPMVRSATGVELRHGTRTILLSASTTVFTVGRDPQSDVVIAGHRASRLHATIERRRDKFALIDQSSNGTYVTFDGESEILLHREEVLLRGSGRISFGHPYEEDGSETLLFACVDRRPEGTGRS